MIAMWGDSSVNIVLTAQDGDRVLTASFCSCSTGEAEVGGHLERFVQLAYLNWRASGSMRDRDPVSINKVVSDRR